MSVAGVLADKLDHGERYRSSCKVPLASGRVLDSDSDSTSDFTWITMTLMIHMSIIVRKDHVLLCMLDMLSDPSHALVQI